MTDFSKPVYFDRTTMTSSKQLDATYSTLSKIVVSNKVITKIAGPKEVVDIPEDGFIIVMNKATAAANLSKFSVGMSADFSENETFVFRPTKTIDNIDFGISGGGELLRNGEYVSQGLIIGQNARNPRTMVGVNKDKSKIYIVCIDGRKNGIGATHAEAAKIMKELKKGEVYPCMGCRSFLTVEDSQMLPNGKHKFYGRFNQGVVTINLVDVACSSEGDMDRFWQILDERLELCHRALRCRHERLLGTISDVAPILWQNGALARLKKGETIDKLLYNGYSTISLGYAGLYEMCMRMLGKSHTDPEAKPFALKVMQRLNDKCKEWREAENISYSVYGTPMESTTYKFAKCLQKRFGIIPGVTDKNYITNSYHVHVSEKIDAFSKLKFEAEFQKLSPGGAISYIEVPNMQTNIPAVLSVMQFIYNNIMYAELNTKSDFCEKCGYDGEIKIVEDEAGKLVWECPNCGNRDQNKLFVARRTCGYIGTQFWNQGRTQEIRDRVLHL